MDFYIPVILLFSVAIFGCIIRYFVEHFRCKELYNIKKIQKLYLAIRSIHILVFIFMIIMFIYGILVIDISILSGYSVFCMFWISAWIFVVYSVDPNFDRSEPRYLNLFEISHRHFIDVNDDGIIVGGESEHKTIPWNKIQALVLVRKSRLFPKYNHLEIYKKILSVVALSNNSLDECLKIASQKNIVLGRNK